MSLAGMQESFLEKENPKRVNRQEREVKGRWSEVRVGRPSAKVPCVT